MKLISILYLCISILYSSAPRCDLTSKIFASFMAENQIEMQWCHGIDNRNTNQESDLHPQFKNHSGCECYSNAYLVTFTDIVSRQSLMVPILKGQILPLTRYQGDFLYTDISLFSPPPRFFS